MGTNGSYARRDLVGKVPYFHHWALHSLSWGDLSLVEGGHSHGNSAEEMDTSQDACYGLMALTSNISDVPAFGERVFNEVIRVVGLTPL